MSGLLATLLSAHLQTPLCSPLDCLTLSGTAGLFLLPSPSLYWRLQAVTSKLLEAKNCALIIKLSLKVHFCAYQQSAAFHKLFFCLKEPQRSIPLLQHTFNSTEAAQGDYQHMLRSALSFTKPWLTSFINFFMYSCRVRLNTSIQLFLLCGKLPGIYEVS